MAHIIYRLDTGGMENGLVNLINNMSDEFCSHVIICLTGFTEFRKRIQKSDVRIYALNKKPGHDLAVYFRLWRLLINIRPDIVHTRNLAALEMNIVALLAGVRARIHGEHGRDIYDLDGSNWKYRLIRCLCRFFVSHYITVSKDLYNWLVHDLGFRASIVTQIYNGVDSRRFTVSSKRDCRIRYSPRFSSDEYFVVGTVGRLQAVKNQQYLIEAFALLISEHPELLNQLRLVIVGDGDRRTSLQELASTKDIDMYTWFTGDRQDVPEILGGFDLFVLPSMAEGISNTILEAMSMGLPVVATNVGGNLELVASGVNGMLVPVNQPEVLAGIILEYYRNRPMLKEHGSNARSFVEGTFSIESMVSAYTSVYKGCH